MPAAVETRYVAVDMDREDRISGRLFTYGRTYDVGPWRERIAPRAFGNVADADLIANVQHDRSRPIARTDAGLTITDDGDAVSVLIAATGPYADEARALVASGIARGLSIEMQVQADRVEDGTRIVQMGRLLGLAVVDKPAYDDAVLRERIESECGGWRTGRWL